MLSQPVSAVAGAVLLWGAPAAPASAQELNEYSLGTVEGLLNACTYKSAVQSEVEYQYGSCIGFIRGVRVSFELFATAQGKSLTCPAKGVTDNKDMGDAVVAEIRSGRHKLSDPSIFAVMDALKKLYPCRG